MDRKNLIKYGLLILLAVFVLRLPAFWTPILDVDESQFAGFATTILKGGTPYVDSLDTKPIGIYLFYAAVFSIFGENNMIAVHWATAIWVALTAFICFRIARRLYSAEAGLWAALFYAVFTTTYIPKFIGTSIVIIMMLPLTLSIDLMLEWDESKRLRYLFLSGIAWGAACLFKYQAGINLIVAVVYILIVRPLLPHTPSSPLHQALPSMQAMQAAEEVWGRVIRNFLTFIFLIGGAIVGTLFAGYLHAVGAWDAFSYWSIHGSAAYVEKAVKFSAFWSSLAVRGGAIVASSILIWFLAGYRSQELIRARYRPGTARAGEYLILIWLALSVVPVCLGGKFYGHYFLQMYPALCILAGGAAARFIVWAREEGRPRLKRAIAAIFIFFIVFPATGFFIARVYADEIYAAAGEENPKIYIPIAEYIRSRTSKDDRILVWGFATPVYTFADRESASRFLWCDWLTGRISGTPSAKDPSFDTSAYISEGSWNMFFDDMKKNRPLYFIDTSPGNYHDYGKYPVSKYPRLADFLKNNYRREAQINGADIYRRNS